MDELKDAASWVFGAVMAIVAGFMTLLAWFTRRDVARYDEGLRRLEALEKVAVTHEQLERVMTKNSAERAAMHSENREEMRDLHDDVEMLLVGIALLAQAQGIKLPPPRARR